jgi:hypothetical protein
MVAGKAGQALLKNAALSTLLPAVRTFTEKHKS